MELDYELNGNIERATWKSTYHFKRRYDYTYDPLNRLKSATYSVLPPPGVPGPTVGQGFTANNFDYDAMGNILSITRYAQLTPNTPGVLIDDLRYKYHGTLAPGEAAPNGSELDISRLLAVEEVLEGEGEAEAQLNFGFKPGSASSTDQYGYDGAGNIRHDPYKDMDITYNHLNLPDKIGDIEILYDATGRKWAMEYPDGTIRLYAGGMEFKDFQFEAANFGDGRIYDDQNDSESEVSENSATPTTPGSYSNLVAEYWHKDHLGNIRVAFSDKNGDRRVQLLPDEQGNSSEVNQILDYYPFGLQHPGQMCAPETSPENRYQYNGKEFVEEVGLLHYGSRWYDPSISRWIQVDPKAHLQESINPYAYSLNSPLNYIDPDGSLPILINGKTGADSERGDKSYWSENLLNTIANSGIANPGGQFHFIDGNVGYGRTHAGMGRYVGEPKIHRDAMRASSRRSAGRVMARQEFQAILAKLEKDPETGLITENIQIYSHSRGGAFAQGFTQELLKLIKQNSDLFADANNVINFGLHLAPHQSNSLSGVEGIDNYSISHTSDGLSGNDMENAINFHTNTGNPATSHQNESFVKEVDAFLDSYLSNGGASQATIDDFVSKLKAMGINVTVQ